MPIGPRRPPGGNQLRAQQTRQTVIDETVNYILDEGFAAPSVRRITKRAGVTWGVVQYHFGDLDALLIAVVNEGFGQLVDALDGLPATIDGLPIEQRTQAVIDAAWQAFSSRTSMAALEILISTRAGRAEAVNRYLAEVMNRLTELGQHLGEGLDPQHATEIGNLIWATLRGIVVAQLVSSAPLDTSRDRQALVEVLTAYIKLHRNGK
ncbi:TetR/AcrR family transcriptional regulator [Mycobacterium sp. 852002-51057_SCH5723018]|uniref:TetR/AcrR family transcriptional regulator n=1 Tax=Mycobacterium sp. 852002-51057_SCH5723018 TaxID=1834094 RepID=UPI000800BB03|nr:TetR/AcrR family transcriptional regulator [Mycobacterium sp. 852002-51057_SCH5723018]OBG27511.1 TetR family transcriptional regulator [Mycobacterium sp. 852002-51057_SCH5723018]